MALVVAVSLVVVVGLIGFAQGGVFTAAVTANPVSADPYMTTATNSRILFVLIYEGLFAYDVNYAVQPLLAQSWERSEDGLEWVITLRQGVLFQNGKEMTAEDVKASLDRYRNYSVNKGLFSYIQSISVVDKYTIKLVLDSPVTTLLADLADPATLVGIMPKEISEDRKEAIPPEEIVGTGPYKLVSWKPDVEFRFARFEDYVPDTRMEPSGLAGWKRAYFDEVVLVPVFEAGSRVAGIETGLYDFAEGVPTTSYKRLLDSPDVTVLILKPYGGVVPELNKTNPPMDNVYFRQALVAAINCEHVMEAVTAGNSDFYRLQPCIFFPEQTKLWNDVGKEYYNAQNVELAKDLLKKAGYNGEQIVYIASQDYYWAYRASLAVTQDLIAAGINVKIEFYDWTTQMTIARSLEGWHISQSGWTMRITPNTAVLLLSPGMINSYGYEDSRIADLIADYRLAVTDEQRMEISKGIMKLYYETVPSIHIGDWFELWATRADIKGVTPWYIPVLFNAYREE